MTQDTVLQNSDEKKILEALVKAQLEIRPPVKDKINPRFKSRYSSIDSIYQACRIPLANNSLVLSHSVETIEGKSVLVTTLYHISGEKIVNKIPLFIENQTSQSFASSLTYARRYAVSCLLGLPTDDDDDGELAEKQSPVYNSTPQKKAPVYEAKKEAEPLVSDLDAKMIIYRIDKFPEYKKNLLAHLKIESFYKLPSSRLESVLKSLENKEKEGNTHESISE